MKPLKTVGLSVLATVVTMTGLGYGYIEYTKYQAKEACQAVGKIDSKQLSKTPESMQAFIDTANTCLSALESIPFKSGQQQKQIGEVRQAVSLLSNLKGMLVVGEAFKQSATVKPVATLVKPSVKFENLLPCNRLDVLAKNGKSISQYLIKSNNTKLNLYRNHIKYRCPIYADSLQVAITHWEAKQPNPSLNVVYSSQSQSTQPKTVSEFQREKRAKEEWNKNKPTFDPGFDPKWRMENEPKLSDCDGVKEAGEIPRQC